MSEKLPPKILVVESDEIQRTSICNTIERYWFTVLRAENPDAAWRLCQLDRPNVVIISSRVGKNLVQDLVTKISKLGSESEVAAVVLLEENENEESFKNSASNIVLEFVHRPFTPNQLMTSIKSLLRRSKPVFQDKVIKYKDLSMDLATYRVQRGTKRIHLGPTEFKIMQMLVQLPKTILSRQQIIDYVWGVDQEIEPRTVDVHVNRLRTLIKIHDNEPPFIKTVRASGYCLNLPGEIE